MAFPVGGYVDIAAALADGCIHYWPVDETSGTTIVDQIAGGPINQDFTVTNDAGDASIVAAFMDNGRDIEGPGTGAARAVVATTTTSTDAALSDCSLSFWVKPHAAMSTDDYQTLAGISGLALDYWDNSGANQVLGLYNLGINCEATATLSTSAYSLITITIQSGVVQRLYINDTEISSISHASVAGLKLHDAVWYWGSVGAGAADEYFKGIQDELAIWNRVLAPSEITELYKSGTGTRIISTAPVADNEGAPAWTLQQESFTAEGAPVYKLRQYSVLAGSPVLLIQQYTDVISGAPELTLQQVTQPIGAPVLSLRQHTYDPDTRATLIWRLVVTLDNVDISSHLTGDWSVDGEQGGARVASFQMLPLAGAIDPTAWVKNDVTIDFLRLESSGEIYQVDRLFTGLIDRPDYDVETDLITFTCTDNLQGDVNAADLDLITGTVGGSYSAHTFRDDSTHWEKLQDRLSTTPGSFDKDVYGQFVYRPWQSVTVNYSVGESDYIAGSRYYEPVEARDLHNTVTITADFRFQRLRQRDQSYKFDLGIHWCEFMTDPFILPTRAMIESAAKSTGWTLTSKITYVPVPEPQVFQCRYPDGQSWPLVWGGGVMQGGLSYESTSLGDLCQGAYWKLSKRWSQTINEVYTVTVAAPQSVNQYGVIERETAFGVEAEQDTTDWEQIDEYNETPNSMYQAAVGENAEDVDTGVPGDRAEFTEAMACEMAIAKTGILAAARGNRFGWECLIDPRIDRHQRLSMTTTKATLEGQVFSVRHGGSIDTGEAVTSIALAISRADPAGSLGDDPLTLIPAPPSLGYISDRALTGLGLYRGGKSDSPDYNEDWRGFITNHQFDDTDTNPFDPDGPHTKSYPVQFLAPAPDIEETDRETVTVETNQTIHIDIPIDPLILMAG